MNNTGMWPSTVQHVLNILTLFPAAGSWLLYGATVSRDATVAKKLRDAGAIFLGKSNMTQWANYRSRKGELHMDGWSAHGGQTYAAYHDKQNPSGSSSGSGVAVDMCLAFAALGTETDGSIVMPAQKSNIVGIKPTVGLTSRDLVIPIAEHHDTVGPMARTVRDAAALLQVIAGKDPNDKYTAAIPDIPDYVAACDAGALKGARIGVPWKAIGEIKEDGFEFEVSTFREALKTLEAAGAVIVDANYEAELDDVNDAEEKMFYADFLVNVRHYFAQLRSNPSGVKDVQDMMDKTRAHADESYPARNTTTWEQALEQGWDNTDTEHFPALLQEYEDLCEKKGLPGTLDRYNLDAMVMPTTESSVWSAVAGAPAVSVPMGFHPADAEVCWNQEKTLVETGPGVPFGLSFMGRKWSEARLAGFAYAFEQLTLVRGKGRRLVSVSNTEVDLV